MSDLWRHAADFHLRAGDAQTAAASLMELHKLNPADNKTLAQLINAYAKVFSLYEIAKNSNIFENF